MQKEYKNVVTTNRFKKYPKIKKLFFLQNFCLYILGGHAKFRYPTISAYWVLSTAVTRKENNNNNNNKKRKISKIVAIRRLSATACTAPLGPILYFVYCFLRLFIILIELLTFSPLSRGNKVREW